MGGEPVEERGDEAGRKLDRRGSRDAGRHVARVAERSARLRKRAESNGVVLRRNRTDRLVRVTDATFELEVVRSPLPVVVDFTAEWCAPCRLTEPTLRDLSQKLVGRVKFASVNVDEASGVTRSYGIHSIPTFLFVHRGQEKARAVGPLDPVAFRSVLRQHFGVARRLSDGKRANP